MAAGVNDKLTQSQSLFFDRAAPGSLRLAADAGAVGLLVMFEPNHIRSEAGSTEAAELSDVVKFSNEVDSETSAWTPKPSARTRLIVQTLGDKGAMFRLRMADKAWGNWVHLPAIAARTVEDTAGAGDWCSAGILHDLLRVQWDERFTEARVIQAIKFGQALAATSVSFLGPQGLLDALDSGWVSRLSRDAARSGTLQLPDISEPQTRARQRRAVTEAVCATCLGPELPAKDEGAGPTSESLT